MRTTDPGPGRAGNRRRAEWATAVRTGGRLVAGLRATGNGTLMFHLTAIKSARAMLEPFLARLRAGPPLRSPITAVLRPRVM